MGHVHDSDELMSGTLPCSGDDATTTGTGSYSRPLLRLVRPPINAQTRLNNHYFSVPIPPRFFFLPFSYFLHQRYPPPHFSNDPIPTATTIATSHSSSFDYTTT